MVPIIAPQHSGIGSYSMMLLLSFLSDSRFYRLFLKQVSDVHLGDATMPTHFFLNLSLFLPACYNVNSFVASFYLSYHCHRFLILTYS